MSRTIDSKVVEMKFDNSQFEANVKTSISTLDKLKQGLNLDGATKGIENVEAASRNANLSGLNKAVETVHAKFSAFEIMAVTALANITNSAVNAGKRIISALTIDPVTTGYNEYELKMGSIQTIMASTGESLETVNKYLAELNEYSDKTIYSFSDMTSNIGKFTNAGVKLEDAVLAIKGVSNVAAVSGANANEASRAMYNFAQALSAGYVKLIDWKSIENANMATVEFKQQLLDAAVASGTVEKTVDGMYKVLTTNAQGSAMDAAIDATHNFNDSLSFQWMTTEVLVETLKKYADETSEIGKKAYSSAQDIKTFSMLFDTLKEAAQSGWAQTWETVIGDFEEAKILLSEINSVISGFIDNSADARNTILQTWKDLSGREVLIESLRNAFEGLMSVLNPIKEAFRDIFPKITGEQLYSLTVSLRNLTEHLTLNTSAMDKLKRTFKGLFAVLDIIKQALGTVFNAIKPIIGGVSSLGDGILGVTASFGDWLVSLNDTIRTSNIFSRIIQKIIDIVKTVLIAISNFIKLVQQKFNLPSFEDLLNILERIKIKVKEAGGVIGIFRKAWNGISNIIHTVAEAIKYLFSVLKEKIHFPDFTFFHTALEKTHVFISNISEGSENMTSAFIGAIKHMGESLSNSKLMIILGGLWKFITTIATGIAKLLGKAVSGLADKIGNADFDNIFNLINTLSFGGIAVAITTFLNRLKEPFNGIKDIVKSITGVLDGIRGCFEAYQTQLKAGALFKIASAIAILTASIILLSTVDSNALSSAVKAITVLFTELMVSMGIVSKMSGKTTGLVKTTTSMIAIAIAVLIMSSALKKISQLNSDELADGLLGIAGVSAILVTVAKMLGKDKGAVIKGTGAMLVFAIAIKVLASVCKTFSKIGWEGIAKGLVGVAGLSAVMVAVAKIIGSNGKSIIKGSAQMVIFAVAIRILASACKSLSKLSWNELAKGLIGVGVLMTEISLFLKTANFNNKTFSTALGIVLLASAIKILASACKTFSGLSWEGILKGLSGIGVLLLEVIAFTKLTGNTKGLLSTGVAMIALGAAMKIFASAMVTISGISWNGLIKGLFGMAGALASVVIAMKFLPRNILGQSIGLIAVATALLIMSNAMNKASGMSWEGIAKGFIVLGGAMAILAVGLNAMKGTLGGSAAMLVASIALALFVPAFALLGAMSWKSVAKGLITIAGAFVIMGVAGLVLSPILPAILGISGAFALLGIGVLGLGAGLLAAGAGLSALAVGFTALAAAGSAGATAIVASLTVIITGVAGLIPVIMAKLGEGIIEFCKVIRDSAPVLGEAITAVLLALVGVLNDCGPDIIECVVSLLAQALVTLVEYSPTIVQAVFDILIACLQGIADNIGLVVETAINIVINFLEGIAKKIPDVIQAGFDILLAFITGLTKAINKNTPLLVEAMQDLIIALLDAAVTVLTGGVDLFKKIGEKIMNSGLVQGIKNKLSAIKDKMSEIITTAKNAISEKLHEFFEIGKNIIVGLINGLKNAASNVWETIKDIGQNIKDGFCDFFGIHSPSKVFYEYGKYMDEGLIEGLRNYSGGVSKATENVGKDALYSVGNVMSKLSDVIDSNIDSEPTIKPIMDLSNIQNGTNSIYGMMQNINGYSLSGSVRMAGITANSMEERNSSRFQEVSLMDKLSRAIQKLTSDPNQTFDNKFYITGNNPREIADEVSKIIQRQVERREASWA